MSHDSPFAPDKRGHHAMEALAEQLANNYFDVTFGYPPKLNSLESDYRTVFKGRERDYHASPRVRNVLLVGAGVSYAAFGGALFPLAREAIDTLRRNLGVRGLRDALGKFDSGDLRIPDRFAEEEQIFRQLYGVPDPRHDFETQLAILSKFYTPRQIRGALSRIYDLRYYPHIVLETIAHLLKHRFIDVVVNYNFDEVLDTAILEEVRDSDRQYVISDGDAVDLSKLVVTDTIKVPLYIKPHGTISHKSTLRFTKDDYVGMPTDLHSFTKKILLGYTREDPRQQRDRFHVNLISVGFAFTSVELLELLRGHPRLTVFHVNLETGGIPADLKRQVKELGDDVDQYLIGIDPAAGPVQPGTPRDSWPTIADAFRDLFQRTRDRFQYPYVPRSTARHEIVHRILFSERDRALPSSRAWPVGSGVRLPEDERHYHLARLCVELAVALAKENGRIDLSTLVTDRVGIYFRNWRETENRGVTSLRSICIEYFELDENEGFCGDIFTLPPSPGPGKYSPELWAAFTAWDAERGLMAGTHEFGYRIWVRLRQALLKIDDAAFQGHVHAIDQEEYGREVVSILARLIHSDVHELAPRFTPEALLLLNAHSREAVIHTQLGMTARYMKMLQDPRWDLLLSVSERGKVLKNVPREVWTVNDPGGTRFRKASIVVADPHDRDILHTRLQGYRENGWVIGQDYRLPYWAHNNHMIVTLRMGLRRGEFEPLAAITYRLPGLENRINPVFIEDPDDLGLLLEVYFGYVTKAEAYMRLDRAAVDGHEVGEVVRDDERAGVPDIDRRRAAETRTALLTRWWDAMAASQLPKRRRTSKKIPAPPAPVS